MWPKGSHRRSSGRGGWSEFQVWKAGLQRSRLEGPETGETGHSTLKKEISEEASCARVCRLELPARFSSHGSPSVRSIMGMLALAVMWGLSIPITKLGLQTVPR